MSTITIKGQFTQGETQRIKKPNKQRPIMFDSDMPRIEASFKTNGHILPKRGAI